MTTAIPTSVVLTRAIGARRAEAVVIEHALQAVERLERSGDFSRPVVVVVPSQSLRLHLMSQLAVHRGGALLGIRCSTHFGVALQVAERSGLVNRSGLANPWDLDLFAILARRFARREPSLTAALEHLREGYSGILGAVRDLLDAGFLAEHLEAVEEALDAEGGQFASVAEVDRAQALARVTARVLASFEELGIGRTSTLLQAATEAVRGQPERALRADSIILHGFADTTGVSADFLEALLRGYGGSAVLDRPPDPVATDQVDRSARFTERLEERLLSFARLEEDEAPTPAAHVDLFRALGQEAEVREVVQRCLDLLVSGVEPETIGIVMREPSPYVTLLRGVLEQLALPYSVIGLRGPTTPVGRRLRACVELAMSGSRTHVERWLDALPDRSLGVPMFDVRIALASLGISRLEELADLDLEPLLINDSYALPVRHGFLEAEEDGDEPRMIRAQRRRVSGHVLHTLRDDASRLVRHLDEWSGSRLSLPEHATQFEIVLSTLGWSTDSAEGKEIARLMEVVFQSPPVAVDQDEFALTLRRLTTDAARDQVGGQGGGVQVMGVVDARGRTFEHLFVLGMNRGVFPRTVREDPVLSDPLRKLLERGGHGLLPDLPIKRRGYEEERYLFAQLLSSSPNVTLSWLERDDMDRPTPPSPLVERLRWCHPARPAAWRQTPLAGRNPIIDLDLEEGPDTTRLMRLPPDQQGVLAALYGRTERLGEVYLEVLRHSSNAAPQLDLAMVAAARLAVIEELDPTTAAASRSCMSPFLGFVGPVQNPEDPRANELVYITALERMAICPWQAFIERLLRVEAVPDPLDALPTINALLIGNLVHRILERILRDALGERPRDIAALDATMVSTVPWPPGEVLVDLIMEEAIQTVRSAGIALRGFDRALAAVVVPYLEVARQVDWPNGSLATVAAEIEGQVEVSFEGLAHRSIGFRADRVDSADEGLLLTDYKTGASPFTQTTPRNRRAKFLREIRSGRRLQPVLYSMIEGQGTAAGRFSFLRPDRQLAPYSRSILVDGGDTEFRNALLSSLESILRAWEQGLFFPRLENPGEPQKIPKDCRWCRVAEACLRQDTGARRRLREGMEALELGARNGQPAPRGANSELRASLLDHWWLASPSKRPGAGE